MLRGCPEPAELGLAVQLESRDEHGVELGQLGVQVSERHLERRKREAELSL